MYQPTRRTLRIGERLPLEGDEPQFLSVTTRKTLFGWLSQFIFKPGIMVLTVTLADGSERTYRIVPEIARKGFLLSPLIENNVNLAALSLGRTDLIRSARVTTIRFDVDAMSALSFDPTIEIELHSLRSERLRTASASAELSGYFRRRAALVAAATSTSLKPPFVSLDENYLFAHAPVTLSLPADNVGTLTFGFGIRDDAWTEPAKTDGVCFRIKSGATSDSATQLWERCLRPLTNKIDRGEQRDSIQLKAQHLLFFEIDCAGTCNWDWSYWSYFDMGQK